MLRLRRVLRQMAAAGQTDTSLAAAHRFHTFQLERDFCLHRWAQSAAMADFAIRTPQLIPVTMEEGRALALAHAADGNWWRRVDMTTLSRLRGELDPRDNISCFHAEAQFTLGVRGRFVRLFAAAAWKHSNGVAELGGRDH